MTAQLPPGGVMQKAQLWNLLLVSATNNARVTIMLRLSDVSTNQPLLTGVSRQITLSKGAKQLQAGDVMPVQYEYLSPAIDRNPNGLLTAGNYLVCYSLVIEGGGKTELGAEECLPFSVEPVSPPLLNMPANESVLETFLPQFSWIPPAPLAVFNDLNYDMVLTEVQPGQSALESVQQNIPVFRASRMKNLFVNYPASAVKLDTAKRYAWTITANNGTQFAAQTDVWTFRIKGAEAAASVNNDAYVALKQELDGAVTSCSGILQCAYSNEAGDSTAQYEVIALDAGSDVVARGEVTLKPGPNLLQVNLNRKARLQENAHYLFRLVNSREERWHLKLIYVRP